MWPLYLCTIGAPIVCLRFFLFRLYIFSPIIRPRSSSGHKVQPHPSQLFDTFMLLKAVLTLVRELPRNRRMFQCDHKCGLVESQICIITKNSNIICSSSGSGWHPDQVEFEWNTNERTRWTHLAEYFLEQPYNQVFSREPYSILAGPRRNLWVHQGLARRLSQGYDIIQSEIKESFLLYMRM